MHRELNPLRKNLAKGFPPLIGIEHQLDFLPRANLPNRLAYMMNPKEDNKLKKASWWIVREGVYAREHESMFGAKIIDHERW